MRVLPDHKDNKEPLEAQAPQDRRVQADHPDYRVTWGTLDQLEILEQPGHEVLQG